MHAQAGLGVALMTGRGVSLLRHGGFVSAREPRGWTWLQGLQKQNETSSDLQLQFFSPPCPLREGVYSLLTWLTLCRN